MMKIKEILKELFGVNLLEIQKLNDNPSIYLIRIFMGGVLFDKTPDGKYHWYGTVIENEKSYYEVIKKETGFDIIYILDYVDSLDDDITLLVLKKQ